VTARNGPSAPQKKRLQEAVEAGLRAVNLWAVRRKKVAQFSGGMKRRLSVAISFIGDPRVVYLDECSTVGVTQRSTLLRAARRVQLGVDRCKSDPAQSHPCHTLAAGWMGSCPVVPASNPTRVCSAAGQADRLTSGANCGMLTLDCTLIGSFSMSPRPLALAACVSLHRCDRVETAAALACHAPPHSGPRFHVHSLQGLDPASRRNLWDVIKRQRAGRGIILTTHNMEEAEVHSNFGFQHYSSTG
jgi:hypothetical protein